MVKNEFDRLAETAPSLPQSVIQEFRDRFSDIKYDDISKPEEANGLEKVTVYDEDMIRKPAPISLSPTPMSSLGYEITGRPKLQEKETHNGTVQKPVPFGLLPVRAVMTSAPEIHLNIVEEDRSSHAPYSLSSSQATDKPDLTGRRLSQVHDAQ
jgi:hypothetical protein